MGLRGQQYGLSRFSAHHRPGGNIRADELNAISEALSRCRGYGCRVFVDHDGGLVVEVEESKAVGMSFAGELWVQGIHFYDSTNFSPTNTNGTAIGGTYSGAVWIQIDLSAGTAVYSDTGPAGATWGDNVVWRRLSECGGSGQYILC